MITPTISLSDATLMVAPANLWDWGRVGESIPVLLEAFVRVTLVVTVLGTIIAAVLGLVWAIIGRVSPGWVSTPLNAVLGFIRMTPIPMQLLFVYFLTPLEAFTIGYLVIGIHYSTYMAESYRAGLEAVPKGQWEAARALSLPAVRTWRDIAIPQALRATLPSLGNWAIAMFKDTPFLIMISVPEMVTAAREYGASNFAYTEAFTVAGFIFLIASYPLAVLMRRLENRLAY